MIERLKVRHIYYLCTLAVIVITLASICLLHITVSNVGQQKIRDSLEISLSQEKVDKEAVILQLEDIRKQTLGSGLRLMLVFSLVSIALIILIFLLFERRIIKMVEKLINDRETVNTELLYEKEQLDEAFRQIEKLAFQDTLTGLWNRRGMVERAEADIARVKRYDSGFCLIMCDIDYFKNVNDSFGHDAGDYILKEMAVILKENCRGDDLVSRWGGEEFLLLLNSDSLEEGSSITEKLRRTIEEYDFIYNGDRIPLTMTFGVALYRNGDDWEDILKRADINLYAGKQAGRNRVIS